MMSKTNQGRAAEAMAAQFLQDLGYEILARNYQSHRWEIDLIARKAQILVFVEVKSRANTAFGYPEAAVNLKKQTYVRYAAEQYLLAHQYTGDIRFDIISIVTGPEQEIVHFEDAF